MSVRFLRRGAVIGGLLASLALSASEPTADLPAWHLHAPAVRLEDGVILARRGFVLRTGDGWTLLGDAVRWDLTAGAVFATGRVALSIPAGVHDGRRTPGLRLEAAHVGLRRGPSGGDTRITAGDAWDVRITLDLGDRQPRLRCRRARFTPTGIVLEGVTGDGGHGGVLGIAAGSLVIGLRTRPAADRAGFERHVADLTAWHLRPSLAGIPVLYTPVMYRDYRLDYPWTRYRVGTSQRLGPFLRGWIDISPPPLGDLVLTARPRLDHYREAGTAAGGRVRYRHDALGEGQALYYAFDRETVLRTPDTPLGTRHARVLDLAHRLDWRGGAAYARSVDLPPADPGSPYDERFRADFLAADLDHRPLARRGASLAHSWPGLAVVVDTDRSVRVRDDATDRIAGAQVLVPTMSLFGPVSVAGETWGERLERDARDAAADRLRYRARFGVDHAFASGLGLGAGIGIEGLAYADGTVDALPRRDAQRAVVRADATLRYRLRAHYGSLSHRITPVVGLVWAGSGHGDRLPAYPFDAGDTLVEDERTLRLGLTSVLSRGGPGFRVAIDSRWHLRPRDRVPGHDRDDPTAYLRSVAIDASGSPIASVDCDARGTWDGIERRWASFDAGASWVPHQRAEINARATWIDDADDRRWQWRPGLRLHGNRYRLELDTVFEREDRFRSAAIGVVRRMVDGELRFGYRLERDAAGDRLDQSFVVAFSFDGFSM